MSDLPIVTRELQFRRGADAARRNVPRDGHEMNHGADAIDEWQAGHDSVTLRAQQHSQVAEP